MWHRIFPPRVTLSAGVFMASALFSFISCGKNDTPPAESITPPLDYCAHTSTGLPPINDLATGFFRGEQGGLYPGGQNTRPLAHTAAGLAIADQIGPLNSLGQPDSGGTVVMLSVGLSNAEQEFINFTDSVNALPSKNHSLRLVNGAQGSWEIDKIVDSTADFWNTINERIAFEGLSPKQVQIVWFKEAEFQPESVAPDTGFPGYPDTLKEKFVKAMQIVKQKFPNTVLCYVASRIYGGYDNTGGNPEPYAYYTGWAVKKLIEDQINGDPELSYSGPSPKVPWLSWGAYIWADGLNPRSDGLVWICPDDYKSDGRHPSIVIGRAKVAGLLMDYFRTDETAAPWLFEQP